MEIYGDFEFKLAVWRCFLIESAWYVDTFRRGWWFGSELEHLTNFRVARWSWGCPMFLHRTGRHIQESWTVNFSYCLSALDLFQFFFCASCKLCITFHHFFGSIEGRSHPKSLGLSPINFSNGRILLSHESDSATKLRKYKLQPEEHELQHPGIFFVSDGFTLWLVSHAYSLHSVLCAVIYVLIPLLVILDLFWTCTVRIPFGNSILWVLQVWGHRFFLLHLTEPTWAMFTNWSFQKIDALLLLMKHRSFRAVSCHIDSWPLRQAMSQRQVLCIDDPMELGRSLGASFQGFERLCFEWRRAFHLLQLGCPRSYQQEVLQNCWQNSTSNTSKKP